MPHTQPVRVRVGVFELDLSAGELRAIEGTEPPARIVLPQQPLRVLSMLLERTGQLVSREEIQKRLWPNDTVVEFEHSINAAIAKLRKAFGDSANEPKYIETIAKRGYRLIAPTEWVTDSGESSFTGTVSSGNGAAARMQPEPVGLAGRIVSHYRVLDIIGGGGMGVVYRAEDLKLGRRVALKFLPEETGNDPKALERFEREARAASALDHPNICSIYEFGEHAGQPFIVMQLLEGETLRERLASATMHSSGSNGIGRHPFPLDHLLDIAGQIAEGLQAAHERGIIHRDIKPANIFLTRRGLVKILDFGVAKLTETPAVQTPAVEAPDFSPANVDHDLEGRGFSRAVPLASFFPSGLQPAPAPGLKPGDNDALNGTPEGVPLHHTALTRTGLAMGTVGYMSPEQVRGEKVDARTDIFSFGVVLYEMATGQRAFNGETAALMHGAILSQTPAPAHELNPAVPPQLEQIINRAIEKDRELRYQTAGEMAADLQSLTAHQPGEEIEAPKRSRWKWAAAAVALIAVATIAAGLYWRSHQPAKLAENDTLVIADFDNTTGDPVFDDTLKRALFIQLRQSPFLNVLPDRKVNATLTQMGWHAGDALTAELAREVCRRSNSKAIVLGSIAPLGLQYTLRLRAVNCYTGNLLAEVRERAGDKDSVLKTLDAAVVDLRPKLGESLGSVSQFAKPLAQGTTASLEALRAFSVGARTASTKGWTAALPFFERAVELDPDFALAYTYLSINYGNLHQTERAMEYARKAYELRDRMGDRERLAIESQYYVNTTGELDKAAQTYLSWQQKYPRDVMAYGNLGFIYSKFGQADKALEQHRAAMRLDPTNAPVYQNLATGYQNLNQLDEAEEVYRQAEEHKLVGEGLFLNRYALAFCKGDTAQMAQLAAAGMGKPGMEGLLLAAQADTEGWYGRLKNARAFTQRAMDSAQRNNSKETAAAYQATAAAREVTAGNRQRARSDAEVALSLSHGRPVMVAAAIALAQAGDTAGAERLAAELNEKFPLHTIVQKYWLPSIGAAVALERKDPNRAVELLRTASPIEFGAPGDVEMYLVPVYLRGEAYLMLHDGKAAAAEYQKFIDHYGLLSNFPWGALARLGLARAYALQSATDPAAHGKARNMYQDFLTIWKDADPDIPIYKQAKAEYAKLQ